MLRDIDGDFIARFRTVIRECLNSMDCIAERFLNYLQSNFVVSEKPFLGSHIVITRTLDVIAPAGDSRNLRTGRTVD